MAIRLDRDYDANVAGLASFSEEGAVYRVDRLTGAPSVLHVFSRSRPLDRVGATPPSWRIWNAAAFPGDLPHTLIHNDCHPANALRAASGDVVFFDWEGAGQGPRIAALGLLLYSCSVQAPDEPPMPSDLERVDAVIGGYASRHALTHAEVQCLPDAVQVRPVVVAARELAADVEQCRQADRNAWWARFAEADAVATRPSRSGTLPVGRAGTGAVPRAELVARL